VLLHVRNRLEEGIASRDAENPLKAPDDLIAALAKPSGPSFGSTSWWMGSSQHLEQVPG
jgi:hypothetical protein